MTIGSVGGAATTAYNALASTSVTALSGGTATSSGSSAAKSEATQLSTPSLFLKLLMVELEHQNPTSPMTPASMLQQTAMLSQVESITSMTTAVDQEKQQTATTDATSLIGKQVTALVGSKTVTGAVTNVLLTSTGTPTLEIDGTKVPLSSVTQVSAPTASSTPDPPPASTTTSTITTSA